MRQVRYLYYVPTHWCDFEYAQVDGWRGQHPTPSLASYTRGNRLSRAQAPPVKCNFPLLCRSLNPSQCPPPTSGCGSRRSYPPSTLPIPSHPHLASHWPYFQSIPWISHIDFYTAIWLMSTQIGTCNWMTKTASCTQTICIRSTWILHIPVPSSPCAFYSQSGKPTIPAYKHGKVYTPFQWHSTFPPLCSRIRWVEGCPPSVSQQAQARWHTYSEPKRQSRIWELFISNG